MKGEGLGSRSFRTSYAMSRHFGGPCRHPGLLVGGWVLVGWGACSFFFASKDCHNPFCAKGSKELRGFIFRVSVASWLGL